MINILLVGYGKMGKMVKENADLIKAKVVAIYDPNIAEHKTPIEKLDLSNIDVAIEFTSPECGFDNAKSLLHKKIPVVIGTTGWFHKVEELKSHFSPEEHTLIYGANFSVGMNLFYEIVEEGSKLINQTNLYDVYGLEAHHRHKADSPSGTAKVLADIILENTGNKESVVFDLNNKPLTHSEFSFASVRAGNIVGYHEIGFDSDFDDIKLVHNAKTRKGFAIGALLAARYAVKHKGFFNFKDIFRAVLNNED
jgi:4-hydroxy-tetrahydrodipicolinate reductase